MLSDGKIYSFSLSLKSETVPFCGALQVALVVKNPLVIAEDTRDVGSIPELRRSSGIGNGTPL